ncbi:MAG: right-handed parallel beta-helix repeat-containing protein, partial [Thermoplasmata archaeon]
MIKRMISIGLSAMMLLSMLVVLDIIPVMNVEATDDPVWNGSYWQTQPGVDWIVDGASTNTYTSTTIEVNGNLIIDDPFSLTLQNVTLIMNHPDNTTHYYITVNPAESPLGGAGLIIEDVAGAPSVITSNFTSNYGIRVMRGTTATDNAYLEMRNSKMLHCGWNYSEDDYSDGGLWIGGDAVIQNSIITEGYGGVIMYDIPVGSTITFENNWIHNNTNATGFLISNTFGTLLQPIDIGPNNRFDNCWWGMVINSSSFINVIDNTFTHNGQINWSGGFTSWFSSFINFSYNDFKDNAEYTVYVDSCSDVEIFKNEINGSANYARFVLVNGLTIKHNYFCNGGPNSTYTYLTTYGIVDGLFDNNVVSNNDGGGALFNLGQTDVINSRFEDNTAFGFGLQRGAYDSNVENNYAQRNGNMGFHVVGNNLNITNNHFNYNGYDGVPHEDNPDWVDCGMDIMNSYDIRVYKNWMVGNANVGYFTGSAGAYLWGTETVCNVTFESNIMDKNNWNLLARGSVNAVDSNSTYNLSKLPSPPAPTPYHVYLEEEGMYAPSPENYITFINVSWDDNTSIHIGPPATGSTGSQFEAQFYNHIKVQEFSGAPVAGAEVSVTDNWGAQQPTGQPFITDSDGRVKFLNLTEFVQTSGGRKYYTPHLIQASETGRYDVKQVNMWKSQFAVLTLNERPTVELLRTEDGPTGEVFRGNTIIIEAEGEDAEDTNDAVLTAHFEYQLNTSGWFNESSPGNYFGQKSYEETEPGENGTWKIEFTPPPEAETGLYDFRVRFNDTYPAFSDWFEVPDMVEVKNNPPVTFWVGEGQASLYRGESAYIYADGNDVEDNDEDGTWEAMCEYWLNDSSQWSGNYITESVWDSTNSHWRFKFEPPAARPDPHHGLVDFRVRFRDPDLDWGDWYQQDNLVDLLNNPPTVDDLKTGEVEVIRGDSIWLFANGTDLEESSLNKNGVFFYYNTSSGGTTWEQGYIGTVEESNGIFYASFN